MIVKSIKKAIKSTAATILPHRIYVELVHKLRFLLYYLRKIKPCHSGALYCPCCDSRLSKFKHNYKPPYEQFHAADAIPTMCPICRSFPRHRMIAYLARMNPTFVSKKNVLIFGATLPEQVLFSSMNAMIKSADLYDEFADLKLDIQKIELESSSIDMIICNHVLEHVPSPDLAVQELRRILKDDGVCIITVPMIHEDIEIFEEAGLDPENRKKIYGDASHLRLFGLSFKTFLVNNGFYVTEVFGESFPKGIMAVIGPATIDMNRVYICTKRVSSAFKICE